MSGGSLSRREADAQYRPRGYVSKRSTTTKLLLTCASIGPVTRPPASSSALSLEKRAYRHRHRIVCSGRLGVLYPRGEAGHVRGCGRGGQSAHGIADDFWSFPGSVAKRACWKRRRDSCWTWLCVPRENVVCRLGCGSFPEIERRSNGRGGRQGRHSGFNLSTCRRARTDSGKGGAISGPPWAIGGQG